MCKIHKTPTGTCLRCKVGIKTWLKAATKKGIAPSKKRKLNGYDVMINPAGDPCIIMLTDTDRWWDIVDRFALWSKHLEHLKVFDEATYLTSYPMWFALKKVLELPEPKYYAYAPTLPMIAMYHGFAYVIYPVTNDHYVICPNCKHNQLVVNVRERFEGYECESCGKFVKLTPEMWFNLGPEDDIIA